MRPLLLDYQRKLPPPSRAGYALLLGGVALALLLVVYHRGQVDEIELRRAELAETGGMPPAPSVERISGNAAQLGGEIRQANAVLRQLTMPWEALFHAVESSIQRQGKEIALLGIRPDAEKRQLRISGEAKNLPVLLDYLRHLSGEEALAGVYLVSHQVREQDRDKPVGFSLIAEWNAR